MKKNITKEQVVETALELMKNKSDLHGLNLREIARALGCAHTNIYNYFLSYSDLLWETHAVLHEKFIEILSQKLDAADSAEMRLTCFFGTFVDTYLDNKGWFQLAWHEPIAGVRPQRNIEALDATNKALNEHIAGIRKELYGAYPDADSTRRILHNTHCYIVGEISNRLLGRGWIEDEAEFRAYVTCEAVHLFKLYLSKKV